jgi:hypothetical protein
MEIKQPLKFKEFVQAQDKDVKKFYKANFDITVVEAKGVSEKQTKFAMDTKFDKLERIARNYCKRYSEIYNNCKDRQPDQAKILDDVWVWTLKKIKEYAEIDSAKKILDYKTWDVFEMPEGNSDKAIEIIENHGIIIPKSMIPKQ